MATLMIENQVQPRGTPIFFTYNARICGWFGAQRKTSPTTCACYVFRVLDKTTFHCEIEHRLPKLAERRVYVLSACELLR